MIRLSSGYPQHLTPIYSCDYIMGMNDAIRLDEPLFIHGEACAVTGIESLTLNNWVQREVVMLGKMHRSKRRLYTIIDLIKLRVIADLARTLKLGPSFAEAISQSVMPRAGEVIEALSKGKLDHDGEEQLLLAWAEPETDDFKVVRLKASNLRDGLPGSHPVIIVPLDEIARDVAVKALAILHNEKAER